MSSGEGTGTGNRSLRVHPVVGWLEQTGIPAMCTIVEVQAVLKKRRLREKPLICGRGLSRGEGSAGPT
jgi:glutamate synthase domain-containing protein 2